MTSDNSSFQSISREVAKRFIQTVVMVDDQAFRSHAEDRQLRSFSVSRGSKADSEAPQGHHILHDVPAPVRDRV